MASKIYVWDKFVRIFHWSLVGLFGISYLSSENNETIHVYSGYLITALLLLRVAWGVVGSKYARFNDFVYSPKRVLQYARSFIQGIPGKAYLGHNPLGGAMIVALLLNLFVIGFSGMQLYAVEEGKGPLSQGLSFQPLEQAWADEHGDREEETEVFWEELHETAVNIMLALIVLHLAGVMLASKVEKQSLVKAMLTGYKEKEPPSPH